MKFFVNINEESPTRETKLLYSPNMYPEKYIDLNFYI